MSGTRMFGVVTVAALLVAGCGGDDADDATAGEPPAGTSVDSDTDTAPDVSTATVSAGTDDVYEPADFSGVDIWVDPVNGDDANDGKDRASAMRTVDAAWRMIPAGIELEVGYRMRLVAGEYPVETSVNYWENRHGTADAPIVIEAADGPHTATFAADINMFGVSHFSLLGVDIIREGDAFHCESCDHILIRDVELSGGTGAHETVKINQSQHIYIENSDIHGADDNAIDFVAVQYGHVIDSTIHGAQDWCMYAKGGSAYLTFSGNEVFDCGTGGITAGQGTGFEFMVAPWLNYEAYGIQIVDNVVHDVEGAGLGVAGGFNVAFAYNTLYNVGTRSHVAEFVHGRRGCDGMLDVCAAHHDAGGWGSTEGEEALIPNRHISFVNNLIVNPAGVQSEWQHFQVDRPLDPSSASGVPSPSLADDDLVIAGNVIWNGPADHLLGLGDGCGDANVTCNDAQVRSSNSINSIEPQLRDPDDGDYALSDESRSELPPPVAVPTFVWDETPLQVLPDAEVVIDARDVVGAALDRS